MQRALSRDLVVLENQTINEKNKKPLSYFQQKYAKKVLTTLNISPNHPYLEELKTSFDKYITSQDEAKDLLSQAVLDSILKIGEPKGPLGVYFFHGPTGVGKTEIVKALAESMFGDPNGFIKINCENFGDKYTGSNLFGAPKGYIGYDDKTPFTNKNVTSAYDNAKKLGKLNKMISSLPWFNILLFDEIEKAHPDVIQQLLGLIDEGKITTSKGEVVNFQNSLIIFTSNIGQKDISDAKSKKHIGFQTHTQNDINQDKDDIFKKSVKSFFKPEFIGRVHNFIEFNELSKEDCRTIIDIEISKLNSHLLKYFTQCHIQFELSPLVYEEILNKGYSKEKGARELVRNYNSFVVRYLNRLLHSIDFKRYFDYKGNVIIGIDIDDEKNIFSQIILEDIVFQTKNNRKLLTLKNKETPSFSLEKLEEIYATISAYLGLIDLDLDGNLDIKDEIKDYVERLRDYGLPQTEISSLKNRILIDRLNELDYISDFEGFGLKPREDNLFYPYEPRTIQKIIEKKLKQISLDKKLSQKYFENLGVKNSIEVISKLMKVEELDPEQIDVVLFHIKKILVEKF